MDSSGPRRTAMLAAVGRAAHLLHHGPRAVLQDWLAWPLLGSEADGLVELGTALLGDDVRRTTAEPIPLESSSCRRAPSGPLPLPGCRRVRSRPGHVRGVVGGGPVPDGGGDRRHAGRAPPCSLALSYVPPEAGWDDHARRSGTLVRDVAASEGEPWSTCTTPSDLAHLVSAAGFEVLEDVGAPDIEPRFGHCAVNVERIALLREGP